MLSFRLHGERDVNVAERLADALQLRAHAVSLSDVSTLVWPQRGSIYGELVRVSVGCENVWDIIADFEQAFEAVGVRG